MKEIAEIYSRYLDRITHSAATVAAICLALIPLMVIADLALRTLSLGTLDSVWEFSAYLMAAAFSLGLAHTLRSGGHIRVGLLTLDGYPTAARILEFAVTLLALFITLFIAWALAELAWRSGVRGSLSPTTTAAPLAVPQTICAFGALLLSLQFLARLTNLLLRRPLEIKPETGPGS